VCFCFGAGECEMSMGIFNEMRGKFCLCSFRNIFECGMNGRFREFVSRESLGCGVVYKLRQHLN
jgi:hypothetical protein